MIVSLGAAAVAGLLLASPVFSAAPPFKITGIQAKLFYETLGRFSEDVLANPKFTLFNVMIGEGGLPGPSNSTLVLVQVSGKAGAYEASRKVRLVATAGRKVMLDRSREVGILPATGKTLTAFWLYDTGGSPVKLSARLTGQARQTAVVRTIKFTSGE